MYFIIFKQTTHVFWVNVGKGLNYKRIEYTYTENIHKFSEIMVTVTNDASEHIIFFLLFP